MYRNRIAAAVAFSALGLTVLSACAGGPAETTNAAPVAVQQVAKETTVKLTATDVADVGNVLIEQSGFTLYRFDKDTANPSKSNCENECAKTWPPLLVGDAAPELSGVDAKLVGKVKRSDGPEQVTVKGWAVYRFAKDTKTGEAKGQGVGNTWFAVTPQGGKAGQAAAPAPAPAPEKETTKLTASEISVLGKVLTDQNGMTLYMFEKDSKKPSKATCNGDCAKTWPPLLVQGKVELQGVDPKIVGSVKRVDGSEQVTVGGWAVYRYSKDTKPGEANGNGVGGTWFAIEPAGCKVGTAPAAAPQQPAAAPADNGGYVY